MLHDDWQRLTPKGDNNADDFNDALTLTIEQKAVAKLINALQKKV